MKISKILPAFTLIAASGLLYNGCQNKNQTKEILPELIIEEEVKPAPLTQRFLGGLKIQYKSKNDSIKANEYIKKIVKKALPYEKEYDKTYQQIVKMFEDENKYIAEGNTGMAEVEAKKIEQQEALLNEIWSKITTFTISSDTLGKYSDKMDFEPNKEYLYDWFKAAVQKK